MALKVTRVDTWAVTIEDRPAGLRTGPGRASHS